MDSYHVKERYGSSFSQHNQQEDCGGNKEETPEVELVATQTYNNNGEQLSHSYH